MKAVMIDKYGGPDVLRIADVPAPKPKGDEVVIAVRRDQREPGRLADSRRRRQELRQDLVPGHPRLRPRGRDCELGPDARASRSATRSSR